MLHTLAIRDFVIVDALELEFGGGFSALTGETGAGKSILIDALELALGARSDPGVIRDGAAKAEISAEFSLGESARKWLEENEIDTEEDVVLLRRVIDASGRSRGFINGVQATAAQMRELGELLVDIHGQHAHQSLLRGDGQRTLLDRHAGLHNEGETVASRYRIWQELDARCREAQANAKNLLEEKERLAWQVEELEKLAPRPDEWAEVSSSHSRLTNAASLMGGAQEALAEMSESDVPVLSRLHAMQQKLSRLAEIDDGLSPVVELFDSARIQLQEAVYMLSDYLSRTDLDPERLKQVEARMEALYSAARKYRVTPEDLPAELDVQRTRLQALSEAQDIDVLQKRADAAEAAYLSAADALSKKRAEAATLLGQAVTGTMDSLSMEGGQFAVRLNACQPGPYGLEQIEFMVAGHAGSPLRPLAKVASGGELARIALAISVITSTATETPTLIFDEVDSGIGGGVAEVVGRLLKKLGQGHQVLCVTHLPQVASQAASHFQVSKMTSDKADHPVSRIVKLTDKERVEEIARMLGGIEITATTRKHAREMLSE
ncbi:DNA repair protein RecN [Oxalobacter vibrioformis]|uniref:DNA repair protein RecN n=1 Tax=Oxalobacter vibrioformis TaxID=933080 RepID=A0A9E9LV19_9BURK|nr:DNA repair protein RecN [Oxalobacter vibrioformis]WAW09242.1 DNA repair protein RecN [Oxalobacter vibrioformis]